MDKQDSLTFLEKLIEYNPEEINDILLQKGKQKMIFPFVRREDPKTLNNSKEENPNGKRK